MANVRLMSANNLAKTQTINGRTYSVVPGGSVDVPDFDATILLADGWINVSGGATLTTVGPTSARPAKPVKNQAYHDITLGVTIVHDATNWRNPATGAIV
jgi:hypothetical protein